MDEGLGITMKHDKNLLKKETILHTSHVYFKHYHLIHRNLRNVKHICR